MCKEKSAGRVERVGMSIKGDFSQMNAAPRGGLQDDSETCYDVW